MLALKLQRIGKKHQPSYRLVVAERRSKLIAPPIEDLGSYSVMTKKAHLRADRVAHWLGVGAQPSVTVQNLLVREGLVKTPKLAVKMNKPVAKPATVEAASPVTSATAEVTETPAADSTHATNLGQASSPQAEEAPAA